LRQQRVEPLRRLQRRGGLRVIGGQRLGLRAQRCKRRSGSTRCWRK
jgi:hypothetical protein